MNTDQLPFIVNNCTDMFCFKQERVYCYTAYAEAVAAYTQHRPVQTTAPDRESTMAGMSTQSVCVGPGLAGPGEGHSFSLPCRRHNAACVLLPLRRTPRYRQHHMFMTVTHEK
ncbi:hypothetical protein BaRGS_00037397 [Batillaria attramentaria]|uniref:Uncharacterized protein n=1 Tax=Batillaria attramentaria TaxID=370345 RepID=A0ABD0J8R2_9CAEN